MRDRNTPTSSSRRRIVSSSSFLFSRHAEKFFFFFFLYVNHTETYIMRRNVRILICNYSRSASSSRGRIRISGRRSTCQRRKKNGGESIFIYQSPTAATAILKLILPSILKGSAVFQYVDAGRVGLVDDESVGQNLEFVVLSVQLHRVRNLVPAESQESRVVASHIPSDDDVRLEIRLPLDLCDKN